MEFNPLEFIEAKKCGLIHRPEEIRAFIDGVASGTVPDYQTSAWLMAVCFNGLSFRETVAMTIAMAESGKTYRWEDDDRRPVVDKHSTGGVGDAVTLIVAPLVAAMGMRMGKHSGRGLGHTGGTIDKLESIPGFRTSLDEKEFRKIVDRAGCAVAGQDKEMTPADGILYSLRDVTATVDQESLIASSIMSKKIAGGAKHILLDVKVGSGAFMKDTDSAHSLSRLMVRIGEASGRKVRAVLSSMGAPLGRAVGNALEVSEAIGILKNEVSGDSPLRDLSVEISARLSAMCGQGSIRHTRSRAESLLKSGAALLSFREMVTLQGGDVAAIENPDKVLPRARKILKLKTDRSGYIASCNALTMGELVRDLGGGRKSKSDTIDPAVGVVMVKRPGEQISSGDTICEIHTNGAILDSEALDRVQEAFHLVQRKPVSIPLFIE